MVQSRLGYEFLVSVKLKVNYCVIVSRNPLLDSVMSQFYPIHTIIAKFSKIRRNAIRNLLLVL